MIDINRAKRALKKRKEIRFRVDAIGNDKNGNPISANIRVKRTGQEYLIFVELIDQDTGERIAGKSRKSGKCRHIEQIDIQSQNIVNALKNEALHSSVDRRRVYRAGDIARDLQRCTDLYDESAYRAVIPGKRGWKSTTIQATAKYLIYSILPRVEVTIEKNGDITESDMEAIAEELCERAISS